MNLLEKTQALIELERSLTRTLEKVEPWLTTSGTNTNASNGNGKIGVRVRPIPTSMDQVHKVLAVARNFSSRTSAPAGWNPNAPVIGFSTPNPLPHQLRGGAMAALELQRARQAEQDKKRKRQEELEEQNKEKAKQKTEETNKNKSGVDGVGDRKEATADKKDTSPRKQTNRPQPPTRSTSLERRVARPVIATTMNLSDSSSEEESDDDDDSD
jgi:hypothetical protein